MRSSLTLLARRTRLLASEVIKNAQDLEKARITAVSSLSEDSLNPYFQQLPTHLMKFFTKYPPAPFAQYSERPTSTHADDANPFLPNKHPVTNSWHKPKYSLKRQADLYKAAYRLGITHLLPKLGNNKRFYEDKYENKRPMAGTQRFKLHKWERNMEARQEELKEALDKADETIGAAKNRAYRKRLEERAKSIPKFL
jgi:large subunit ribosomal protein L25